MTDVVVDASIVMSLLVKDSYTSNVRSFFLTVAEEDQLYIPEFCMTECRNVLWKQVRFHGMKQDEAEQLLSDLSTLPFTLLQIGNALIDALRIGLAHQLAVYDSVYIARAKTLNVPLITVDARQERAAIASSVTIKPITDFPPLESPNA